MLLCESASSAALLPLAMGFGGRSRWSLIASAAHVMSSTAS
jgi:hypothetical protein